MKVYYASYLTIKSRRFESESYFQKISKTESTLTMEESINAINHDRQFLKIADAWVDEYDTDTDEQKVVWHKCFLDYFGEIIPA